MMVLRQQCRRSAAAGLALDVLRVGEGQHFLIQLRQIVEVDGLALLPEQSEASSEILELLAKAFRQVKYLTDGLQ